MTRAQELDRTLQESGRICVAPMGEVRGYVYQSLRRLGFSIDCYLDADMAKRGTDGDMVSGRLEAMWPEE